MNTNLILRVLLPTGFNSWVQLITQELLGRTYYAHIFKFFSLHGAFAKDTNQYNTISVHNDISTHLHFINFALHKLCKNTNVTFYYPDQQMHHTHTYVYVCVLIEKKKIYIHTHTHIYMCVCVK